MSRADRLVVDEAQNLSDEDLDALTAPGAEPEEAHTASSGTVKLRVVDLSVVSFNIEQADGDTLVINRKGTEVPATDAEQIVALAARQGVTLEESN